MKNLPVKFTDRMKYLLGDEYYDYEAALNLPPVKAFRVNTSKISVADFEKINPFGNKKIPYVNGGYYLEYDKVGNHPFHHAGMIYVQEPAAMAPAECIDIHPDSCVLDTCAAPGGKSTQLKNKLASGGTIVYATCTFSLEENEMVIDRFLQSHPEFEIVPVKEEVAKATSNGIFFDGCKCRNIEYARRFYPHKNSGEGQFMAVLHHKGETVRKKFTSNVIKSKMPTALTDFLNDVLTDYCLPDLDFYGETPIFYGGDVKVKKGDAFACGVTVGEIKKNYVLPHHQFFSAYGNGFKRKIELPPDSELLKKYLHGEEIPASCENGWAAVTACGVSVGGAKVVNGTAKNHYPKGLRIKNI